MPRSARIFSRELKLSVIRRLLAGENVSALARELPVTSTAILNEKRSPDDKHRGSILSINTPRKDWGDAFRALISRRYGIDSQGIVCREKGPPRDEARDNRRKQKRAPQPIGALRLGEPPEGNWRCLIRALVSDSC
jgi:hypothetical protein